MTVRLRLLLSLPAVAGGLAGCVAADGFPSLAQRPAERNISIEEPVRPAVDVPSDPALRAQIVQLLAQAADGNRAFYSALAPAQAAVAAAGGAGSESWVEAQQALSRLEATREPTARALAELDRLALARAELPTNEGDFAAISAAIAEAGRIAADQQQVWDRLRGRLASLD